MKKYLCLLVSSILLVGCNDNELSSSFDSESDTSTISSSIQSSSMIESSSSSSSLESTSSSIDSSSSSEIHEYPKVEIFLSNNESIKIELYDDIAPITVTNFLKLVDEDYYDGVFFHRIISDFMVQTGAFYIDGQYIKQKESVSTIVGEFKNNGYTYNTLKHVPGVISMARANAYDSGSNQFFICVATCNWLDNNYAGFGKTIDQESLDVVIELSTMPTYALDASFANFPYYPVSITSIERI